MRVTKRLLKPQLVHPVSLLLIFLSVMSVGATQIPLNGHTLMNSDWLEIERALVEHGVQLDALPHEFFQSPGCEVVCSGLRYLFPTHTITRSEPEAYHAFTNSYWSNQQAELAPTCIFKPSTPRQLAIQILLSRLTSSPFAIKAGGHASFAGASSIRDGVAVSLELFDEVTVSEDGASVIVGAGNRWGDVYTALQPHELTVVGGRDADVGVGGLVLGGGMSFFSNLHGWACDNVAAYEIVLASGAIVRASAEGEHAHLYWALRGGGGNFGVVTRFWMDSYPLPEGMIWAGSQGTKDVTKFAGLFDAFYTVGTDGAARDGRAAQILSVAQFEQGTYVATASLTYTELVAEGKTPEVLRDYFDLFEDWEREAAETREQQRQGYDSSRHFRNQTQSDIMGGQPPGRRNTYWTFTCKLRREAVGAAWDLFAEELDTGALDGVEGLVPALLLQVITSPVLRAMQKRGGNPLGLEGEEPRLLVTTVMAWDHAADDVTVMKSNKRIVDQIRERARSAGWDDRYVYMNYASQEQDVVTGYGEENHERLIKVARRYDPTAVFQKLVSGYHQLSV